MTWIEKLHAQNSSLGIKFIRPPIRLASSFFALAVRTKNWLYNRRIASSYQPKSVVVSVGNIVAGGVGKTPFTLKLAQSLIEHQVRLALLSRGYLSKFEHKKTPTLICKGNGPIYSAHDCGDEPYLISKNVPKAHFYVGKDRVKSAQMAEELEAEVLLLDDAMQHRRLHRDFEITVIDAKDPFGKGYFLPYGFLREPIESLQRSDLIVLNHVESIQKAQPILLQIKKFTNAPCLLTQVEVKGFFGLNDHKVESLSGVKVGAYCGLGQPQSFFNTLKKQELELVLTHKLGDHKAITTQKLESFCIHAKNLGAQFVVCSEKDAVKLSSTETFSLPILQLKIGLKILAGEEIFKNLMQEITAKSTQKRSN